MSDSALKGMVGGIRSLGKGNLWLKSCMQLHSNESLGKTHSVKANARMRCGRALLHG